MGDMELSRDTVLQLAPGIRTRWNAAGHVVVDSPVGTIIDIGPRGFAILSRFSQPLRLGSAIDQLEREHGGSTEFAPTMSVVNMLRRRERAGRAASRPSSDERVGRPRGACPHAP